MSLLVLTGSHCSILAVSAPLSYEKEYFWKERWFAQKLSKRQQTFGFSRSVSNRNLISQSYPVPLDSLQSKSYRISTSYKFSASKQNQQPSPVKSIQIMKIIVKPQHQVGVIIKCDQVLFNALYLYFCKNSAHILSNQ